MSAESRLAKLRTSRPYCFDEGFSEVPSRVAPQPAWRGLRRRAEFGCHLQVVGGCSLINGRINILRLFARLLALIAVVAFLIGLREVRTFVSVNHSVPGWVIALAFVALAALGNRAFPSWISRVKAAPAYLWGRLCAIPLSVLPGTVLFGEVLIFFRRPLFSSTVKIPFDLEGYHLPIASFIAKSLRNGEFPFWDPYSYCGAPIYANLQAQIFYPPAWPVFLLGSLNRVVHNVFRLLEWQVAIHVFLGGAFAYLLLRRLRLSRGPALFGASIFQLGGFFASQAQHLGAVCGAAWLPLAWLAIVMLRDRFEWRSLALLALAFALSFLAGFPANYSRCVWLLAPVGCRADPGKESATQAAGKCRDGERLGAVAVGGAAAAVDGTRTTQPRSTARRVGEWRRSSFAGAGLDGGAQLLSHLRSGQVLAAVAHHFYVSVLRNPWTRAQRLCRFSVEA